MKKKGKAGRPPKRAGDKWSKLVTVRFTRSEYNRLARAAKQAGMRLASFLHHRLTGD